MSENKITIESVNRKEYNGNVYYEVKASGKKYSSKIDLSEFIGKTGEADVASKQKGNFTNYYINKFTPVVESKQVSQSNSYDQGKRENTLIMCAKDLGVAAIMSGQLDPKDTDKVAEYVLAVYTKLSGVDPEIPF